MKYHFGCGTNILPGYINCDSYHWPGVDWEIDLTGPEIPVSNNDRADEIFSNAFLEHLYVRERHVHLEAAMNILKPGGFLCYLGIPWFPGIARAYLERTPATSGKGPFDIYHAYRYTHGCPESAGYSYLGQLHKGLFDEEEFLDMFERVEIEHYSLFTYIYPGEPQETRVTAGMYVSNASFDTWDVCEYLKQWDGKYLKYESVRFVEA